MCTAELADTPATKVAREFLVRHRILENYPKFFCEDGSVLLRKVAEKLKGVKGRWVPPYIGVAYGIEYAEEVYPWLTNFLSNGYAPTLLGEIVWSHGWPWNDGEDMRPIVTLRGLVAERKDKKTVFCVPGTLRYVKTPVLKYRYGGQRELLLLAAQVVFGETLDLLTCEADDLNKN